MYNYIKLLYLYKYQMNPVRFFLFKASCRSSSPGPGFLNKQNSWQAGFTYWIELLDNHLQIQLFY
jgi:hypothetical protein